MKKIFCLGLCLMPSWLGALGNISPLLKVDNFGWRSNDRKVAVAVADPGSVELRDAHGDQKVADLDRRVITLRGFDPKSGDKVWEIDFSGVTKPGSYYLYSPKLAARSYDFEISDDIYNIVGAVALKSYYYQRCNTAKAAPYAGAWTDGACHLADLACPNAKGSPDYGRLDLRGGWHDAGDFQKNLGWFRGVEDLLWAYELNPATWYDSQTNVPESHNNIPDILDEAIWELDYYVRMQRPDGHFMVNVKGVEGDNVSSPPSRNNQGRHYFDSPKTGDESSDYATAHAVLTLAHASMLLQQLGQPAKAEVYRRAAMRGWTWLRSVQGNFNAKESALRLAATAAIWRLDTRVEAAGKILREFQGWYGESMGPANRCLLNWAAWHALANPHLEESFKAKIRAAVAQKVVDQVFKNEDAYSGLVAAPGDTGDYHWGSNQNQGNYGAQLMLARHFGACGSRSEKEVSDLAQKFVHYLLGRNTLNMVYLTNMAKYGGEHSSFQLFHGWFSVNGNDSNHGNPKFNGKPFDIKEPLYPYYREDRQTSQFGPAPGLVVGGPNLGYGAKGSHGTLTPPKGEKYPGRAYRDISIGCGWSSAVNGCTIASWELTEPDVGYQAPVVLLLSFFMSSHHSVDLSKDQAR